MRYQLAKTNESVIFLHIPKTAGTTLDQIIYRHYRYLQVYETGINSQAGVEAYKKMNDEVKRDYKFLKGHMDFGIHQHIPGSYAYFTFLREPIDRTISHLYFIHRHKGHPAYKLLQGKDVNIKIYLDEHLEPMLFNAHTRLLSGAWAAVPIGGCTEVHLELAKENLKNHFRVISLTERFDESLLLLGKVFGWKHLYYKRLNITKKRPLKEEIPSDLLTAIQNANQLDILLYEYAQTLFEEQLQQLAPKIKTEVIWFRLKNRLWAAYWEMRKISVRVFIREQLARFRK
jgi:hypothetical protein